MTNPRLKELFTEIEARFAAEYQRGVTDTIARGIEFLRTGLPTAADRAEQPARRAPKGAADARVRRALDSGPKSLRDITLSGLPDEDDVSYSAIRLALKRGLLKGTIHRTAQGWYKLAPPRGVEPRSPVP